VAYNFFVKEMLHLEKGFDSDMRLVAYTFASTGLAGLFLEAARFLLRPKIWRQLQVPKLSLAFTKGSPNTQACS